MQPGYFHMVVSSSPLDNFPAVMEKREEGGRYTS
jgi:hypothetical protein